MHDMSEVTEKITATVPIFFFVYQLQERKVKYISPQFYELAEGVEKKSEDPLKTCIHPDYHAKFDDFFQELSEQNRYEGSVELKAADKLKGIEWVELNSFPVRDQDMSDVKEIVGHIVNISGKKEVYDLLREEKEHINNMLNMVVHDLRAPFHRIHMIAELLEGSMTEEERGRHKTYLDMLRKQEEESQALIQRLLKLATLKGSANSLDLKIHDLRRLVKESVSQEQGRIEERELNIAYNFPEQRVKARVDAVLFLQVLANLLSNAIKYTHAGGAITFHLLYVGKHIELKVQDSGIGIPEKFQQGLFQDFRGIRRKGLDGEESTGLGLFICKEIVRMHQGVIEVDSKEGDGTTFTIILPFPESSAAYY